ncbi:hypothetical protein ASE00_12835 [Sphingomonas sp. Root710]|nr:hypothetical protein ASE00_12835 [Sphingomonas sp. Root710]
MGLMTSQRSLWPWTTRVTMRHLTDVAHSEAAAADLGKNDEPGNDDLDQDGDLYWIDGRPLLLSLDAVLP